MGRVEMIGDRSRAYVRHDDAGRLHIANRGDVSPRQDRRNRSRYAYGCGNDEDERIVFLRACAGRGAIDCPAYDGFVAALQGRGWLPKSPDLEPNPDGEGRIGRWRLTTLGLAEVRKLGIRLE